MERFDPAQIHPAVPHLVKMLAALGAQRIILYGSRARGDNMPRADIDLAIDAPDIESATWTAMKAITDNAETLLQIDLVRLQDIEGKFLDNILRDGKLLHDAAA